ncbi:MAG TPA: CBASS oligonucleotide cyclase [Longimicrobium sp.]
MELNDAQVGWFVDNRLKLEKGKRSEYLAQVDGLIVNFTAQAKEDANLRIVKFLKTGSLRKGTVLRPGGGVGVDADIAVFLTLKDPNVYDLDELHDRIRALLIAAYPGKSEDDFTVQPRTLGIEFRTSGLALDLVPVIPIDGPDDYGLQPSSRGEPFLRTSVTKQLEFIRARKEEYGRFTSLVRLLKHWRNQQELDELRSFIIELLVSHLQDVHGPPQSLEDGLRRFFLYLAQSELREPVVVRELGTQTRLPADRVVILDPVNAENNVARRLTDEHCGEIAARATDAWEALNAAHHNGFKGETLELWKEVFGRSFAIEE